MWHSSTEDLILAASTAALLIVTAHALLIHSMAGELNFTEIILIEVLWIPILYYSRGTDCWRPVLVLFAAFSGYFLPRLLELLPWSILKFLFIPDLLFNNFFFELLHLNAKMVLGKNTAGIITKDIGAVAYLVGCSTLRSIPMLVATAIAIPVEWRKRLLASVVGAALSFPANALRVALILIVARQFHLSMLDAHILMSPILTIVLLSIVLYIQHLILDKKMFDYIENGFDCLIDYLTRVFPKHRQRLGST